MTTWPTIKLGDATCRIGGGTPSRKESSYWGGDLPWFTVADLKDIDNIQELTTSRECITRKGLKNSAAKLVPAGAIVFSSRVVVGKVGISKNELVTNQDFSSFVPIDSIDTEFLAYFLIKVKADLRGQQRGATIRGVTTRVLDFVDVPHPSLTEQRRIVSRIKEGIKRVEEIESLQHSIHDEASLLPTAFRYDLWNECAKSANMVELSSVADSTKNGLYKPKKFHGQGMILLRMFNINGASLNLDRIERLEVSKKEALDYRVSNGDIIVSRVNSRELVGKSALVEGLQEEAVHEAMIIRLRVCDTQVDKRFLVWLINSPQFLYDLRGRAKHAIGQSSINQKDLLSSRIPLPSIEEQRIKVESMSDLPSLAADLVTECNERQAISGGLRQSILRKAFAGEL